MHWWSERWSIAWICAWLLLAQVLGMSIARADAPRVVRIAVVAHSDRELVDAAATQNSGASVRLQAVAFPDAAAARRALAAQRVDASIAEDAQALAGDASLCAAAYTVTYPMGLYARRIGALRQVPLDATVAVPADRAGQGRALLLLQNHGLIRIDANAGLQPRVRDIVDNPRKLRVEPVPASRLAAALPHHALVAMPFAVADAAGLAPARDALGIEDARVPWANALAVRASECHADWVRAAVRVLHSPAMKAFILTHFQDSVRRPW
ncbi:MetQ/NlpA family ABC transporter substrate-binding protein [Cupriavidus pauculus]|uniref:MetQ/NlpA family ABC transporter substrate-binding protein n=1 Tax=Cupriavidus pauculus TaxID=82633 RepID=UPI0038573AD2